MDPFIPTPNKYFGDFIAQHGIADGCNLEEWIDGQQLLQVVSHYFVVIAPPSIDDSPGHPCRDIDDLADLQLIGVEGRIYKKKGIQWQVTAHGNRP